MGQGQPPGCSPRVPNPRDLPLSSPPSSPLASPRILSTVHATRCWGVSGIQFINSKNCRFLFFLPLHLLLPQSKTAAASQRLHLYGLGRTALGIDGRWWQSACFGSQPHRRCQCTPGSKIPPNPWFGSRSPACHPPVRPTHSQATAWLEFSPSSLPTSPRALCSPAFTACAGIPRRCVGRRDGTWDTGSRSAPLLSALSPSPGAAVPGQTVCRNWGSRVIWAPPDPTSGCWGPGPCQPHAVGSARCPFPVRHRSRARGSGCFAVGVFALPSKEMQKCDVKPPQL